MTEPFTLVPEFITAGATLGGEGPFFSGISAAVHEPGCAIPVYMRDVYRWAYLDPRNARLLDRDSVVAAILLGNSHRLQHALLAEVSPGDRVLQAAHVYGSLIPGLARRVGGEGRLDVIDVVPLQVDICRRKLAAFPQARVLVADAGAVSLGRYDVVSCFFLLHELPEETKRSVVDNLLSSLSRNGRAVFIDYHRPASWHPLRSMMQMIYKRFEPFAESLWRNDIHAFATDPEAYTWEKQTFFGGLYQKTVVSSRPG